MSARVRQAPPRERRSQTERTAETRERVMAAVVESIAEVGYPKTTANEIARRAGVTWGAVQHHFGDKDGILVAVLEESFDRFAELLADHPDDLPKEALSLEERVSLFIDRSWLHFGSAHYRSTFEILQNLPPELELSWRSEVTATWNRIWVHFFPESLAATDKSIDLMRYTVSVMSGIAVMSLLEGAPDRSRSAELRFLKQTLIRELGGDDASH